MSGSGSFASRVGKFDLGPADDEEERLIQPKDDDASLDDIEKEYLIGGGGYVPVDHEVHQSTGRGCCNLPGSKGTGAALALGATIGSMVIALLLLYSSIKILSVQSTLGVMGSVMSGIVFVNGVVALIGLRLYTRNSIAFKFSHWIHMITFWALLAYLSVQLHKWDGSIQPMTSSTSTTTTPTTTPVSNSAKTAIFLQLAAPSKMKDALSFMASPVWLISLIAVLIGLNIMYLIGSLQVRTKQHARWGATVVSWLALLASLGLIGLSVYSLISYSAWQKWDRMLGIVATAVGAALTVAGTIVSFWADARMNAEQVKASERVNLVLYILTPAIVMYAGAYVLYYMTIAHPPVVVAVRVVSFLGISIQMLLVTLVIMLFIWKNNLTDSYKAQLGTELFADAESFENNA